MSEVSYPPLVTDRELKAWIVAAASIVLSIAFVVCRMTKWLF